MRDDNAIKPAKDDNAIKPAKDDTIKPAK